MTVRSLGSPKCSMGLLALRAMATTALFLHKAIAAWRANNQTPATTKELRSMDVEPVRTRRDKDGLCRRYARVMPGMGGGAETGNIASGAERLAD